MAYPEELGIAPLAASALSNLNSFNVGSTGGGLLDLKGWRVEPFMNTFKKFSPDKKGLEWKYPLQSRWFTFNNPLYGWLGPDTVIKELDTKLPINLYDKAGQVETLGEGFTTKGVKSAADFAKEEAFFQEWLPSGDAKANTEIVERFPTRAHREEWNKYIDEFWKKYKHAGGKYGDNPAKNYKNYLKAQNKLKELRIPMTEFEAHARYNISKGRAPINVMTPPMNITNQAKVNLLESFLQNFRNYDKSKSAVEHLREKGIHYPKSKWESIMRIPHKAADIFQRYRAGQPIKSGIPWSTIGRSILNNPLTRFVGGAGNVALGGQALLDIGTGSQHTKNMMTDINRFAGVPVDRQGNVIQSNRVYENLQNVAQRDVLNPNEMRGVTSFDTTRYNPREMNTGGIASLR
jgi:hypothetical protein